MRELREWVGLGLGLAERLTEILAPEIGQAHAPVTSRMASFSTT